MKLISKQASILWLSRVESVPPSQNIDVRLLQDELDDLHVAVLGGAHERGGAVLVADVDVGARLHQQLGHAQPAVADGQHERSLEAIV